MVPHCIAYILIAHKDKCSHPVFRKLSFMQASCSRNTPFLDVARKLGELHKHRKTPAPLCSCVMRVTGSGVMAGNDGE